jgi:hypothetical protein
MKAPLLKIPPPKCASFPLTVEELKVASRPVVTCPAHADVTAFIVIPELGR